MKDITLKIIGNQVHGLDGDTDSEETMEFITEGRFMSKGSSKYLIYDESELSGVEGCTTSLKITDEKVKMRRYGMDVGFEGAVEFEKGKRWDGFYDTPFGPIQIEVLTNKVEDRISSEGTGSLAIDCSISLKGVTDSRSKLSFEIMQ
jgi:uncharacterized beta-barrel protein YwiB (DUF1934 family)